MNGAVAGHRPVSLTQATDPQNTFIIGKNVYLAAPAVGNLCIGKNIAHKLGALHAARAETITTLPRPAMESATNRIEIDRYSTLRQFQRSIDRRIHNLKMKPSLRKPIGRARFTIDDIDLKPLGKGLIITNSDDRDVIALAKGLPAP